MATIGYTEILHFAIKPHGLDLEPLVHFLASEYTFGEKKLAAPQIFSTFCAECRQYQRNRTFSHTFISIKCLMINCTVIVIIFGIFLARLSESQVNWGQKRNI